MVVERLDSDQSEDRLQIALHRARYDFALRLVRGAPAVLEVGFGCGGLLERLIEHCASVTAVDFDQDTVLKGQAKYGARARLQQADAKTLPFPDASFSHIVCLEVLEHLGDYQAGVREIHRCLQPGGRVIASVPWRKQGGTDPVNPYHLYEPGEAELVNTFRERFRSVETYYQYYEESAWMTFARKLRLRRLLGLAHHYAGLVEGRPEELSRLRLEPRAAGMIITLVLVAGKASL